MAKKKAKSGKKKEPVVPIEEAMQELEEIVETLESGQASLTDSLSGFERGMLLLRNCHQQLDVAAQKIDMLVGIDDAGEISTVPFDGTATAERKAAEAADESDQEDPSSLF